MNVILNDPHLMKERVVGLVVEGQKINMVGGLVIPVDETQAVEELIEDLELHLNNNNISSKNFPKPNNGQKTEKRATLFNFGKNMPWSKVLTVMDKVGHKPTAIWDILGLAKKYQDFQMYLSIVAPGSVCELHGIRHVAFLSNGRFLHDRKYWEPVIDLVYLDCEFDAHHWFLGVPK